MERSLQDELIETLREAQRLGFFGDRPIEEAVAHARQFVTPISDAGPGRRVLDLGSGGGLPGLVIAAELPDATVVLVDRRQKRTDFLARAASRLGFEHVDVWCRDARDVASAVAEAREPAFDIVTARGFGPPDATLRIAADCVSPSGRIVISEPPSGDRWPAPLLDDLRLSHARRGAVAVFDRR